MTTTTHAYTYSHILPYTRLMRTNIEIDEELIQRVMDRFNFRSKREAVHESLRQMVGDVMTVDEALAMQGSGWAGDLEAMRSGDVSEW